jgi:S-adenosylmethionine hydrolase
VTFIGPDNGCLSPALSDGLRGEREESRGYKARSVRLDPFVTAVSIENQSLFRTPVSATFEGRDVFAPAAAFLARGGGIQELGPRTDQVQAFRAFQAPRDGDYLAGVLVHVDTFGNLISDIRADDVPDGAHFEIHGREMKLVKTYADAEPHSLVAIAGSSGFIEIAWPNGSAASVLQAQPGDEIDAVFG